MATYKAVMRPALEYSSSIWSPLASSTKINKLQVIQNAALRTAIGCIQDTNLQHLDDETLTLPIHENLQLQASQYKQKTQHPSHHLHKHTTYFITLRLKNYFQQRPLHNKNYHRPPHSNYNIKRNMPHIHTSIVTRHLATRGNNKIRCAHLHHTLAALKRYFPSSLVAPLPNSEQTNLPSSNHTYTKSTPKHIHHRYASSVTPTHTTQTISLTALCVP